MDTSRPIYALLQDRGKEDPYHKHLSDEDLKELALLWFVAQHSGDLSADDLIALIDSLEDK